MAAQIKTAVSSMANGFVPRATFDVSPSIVRSYFLGHHQGALNSMRKILSNIGLVIECRDSRVPLTSTNPLLEQSLAGRDRIIVYTKSKLTFFSNKTRLKQKQEHLLQTWHAERSGRTFDPDEVTASNTHVVFTDESEPKSIQLLLDAMKDRAKAADTLTGLRALVVGMPNAGKSSLLNSMRQVGMNKAKAARTGAQPGVTRKLSTPVRVIPEDMEGGIDQGVFVVDTPGVFVPYVGEVDAMLKLSLVGCVKDSVVPWEILADYLLFHLNLRDPDLYGEFCAPTNNAADFLDAVAMRTGKLEKGGTPSREFAAPWIVQQFRKGNLGKFCLDEIDDESLQTWARKGQAGVVETRKSA
ncbi:P-loop containing nucleoside triphosphate hydrolase protein [Apiospora hydei]|uniref:P-loop containing nucleoside triphosphate hydrolase protein n=1 Tax=Apiospora hydei TaxID=1337664 RepID=A0ABR1VUW9_9PEZI